MAPLHRTTSGEIHDRDCFKTSPHSNPPVPVCTGQLVASMLLPVNPEVWSDFMPPTAMQHDVLQMRPEVTHRL